MWKNISVNKQNVKVNTKKAFLIAMPHNSKYDGFQFWHPAKLVRRGKHLNALSLGYTDDFKFKLVKYGNGKYNSHDVVDTLEINAKNFEEAFETTNDNVSAPRHENEYETYKPDVLEAKQVEVLDDLKDE